MSDALRIAELSPEALALIKAGTPSPTIQKTILTRPLEDRSVVSRSDASTRDPVESTKARSGIVSKPKASRQAELADQTCRPGLVSLSVRVPAEIPDALVRASADRRIKRQRPFTHQDITVEALTLWLRKNGYVS